MLTQEVMWNVVSDHPVSNRLAYSFIMAIAKALNFKFWDFDLRKMLSTALNIFWSDLTVEKMNFKDNSGEDVDEQSTLVYTKNLKATIRKIIKGRRIKKPHINICIDGGQQKLLVILQIYDLSAPPHKKGTKKPMGRDRAIIIARQTCRHG